MTTPDELFSSATETDLDADTQPVNLDAEPQQDDGEKTSAATRLVRLALARYRLGVSPEGEPFSVPTSGPRIVRTLRGGKTGLRAELADAYWQTYGKTATQQALADALAVLDGQAARCEPEPLALRVAEHDGRLFLDLGDAQGRAVRIDAEGWRIVEDAPVLFRRTALTGQLPEPVRGGDLSELWDLLNVTEQDRPLILAYLVACLWPDIPHPLLALLGEQGTGKTSAAKVLTGLVDPSPVPVRKAPRDADSWVTAAAGSWVVALDKLSGLPEWLSDTLCRAVTGDGDVRRRLYTDGDLAVFTFRRCLILTGIDLGALRDDLADRSLIVELDRIPAYQRRRESDLWQAWQTAHPCLLGALLDLAVSIASVLPSIRLDTMPRMADYGVIQAAVDRVLGTDGLARYANRAADLAAETVAADPFLAALAGTLTGSFNGSAAELLDLVGIPERPPKGWPTSARALTTLLKRNAPAMRRAGWQADSAGQGSRDRTLQWAITRPNERESVADARNTRNARISSPPAQTSPQSASGTKLSNSHILADARTVSDARSVTAGQDVSASVTSNASDITGQSQAGVPAEPVAADCGHPAYRTDRCPLCLAEQGNAGRATECRYCDRPALPGSDWCDLDNAEHQHARVIAGVSL